MSNEPPIYVVPTRRRRRIPPLNKGVYLLPNLFTTGGLFAGFYSIIATLRGKMVAEAAMHDAGVAQPVDAARLESKRTIADAVEAIAALGYSRGDAKRMVADAMADDAALESLEAITLAVLRRLDVRT